MRVPALLAFVFLAGATAPLSAQSLSAALTRAAADLPAGGFAYAEIKDGNVTHGHAGKLTLPAGVPSARVLFEIGSITKVFTGLLLAQASLDGKVALDDPIAKHLPAELQLAPAVAAITLQQLSSHTSGFPRLPDNLRPADAADPYADYTVERLHDFLRRFVPDKPAPQPADYSNLGTGLLGHLLARAYGVTFAELVRTKITAPLGLTDTVIDLDDDQRARFAPPHSGKVAVSPWRLGALPGAGALRSTTTDLAKFAQALLDPASPIAPAWRIARDPRAPMGARGQVGLGFFLHERAGRTVYNHGGGTGGFRAHFEITPATKSAVVVLLNNDHPDPGALVALAATPVAAKSGAPAEKAPPAVPITPAEIKAFAGVYEIDARGRFTAVVDEQHRLRIRLTGQPFLPVRFIGQDRFAATAVAAQFQFARDAAGKITAVTLHQNGRETPARRTADAPTILFPSAEKLRDFAGDYQLAPNLVFEIRVVGINLIVKLTGQLPLPVHATKPDHFVYDVVDAALTFERDATGAVTAVVLHQNGRDQRAPKS